MTSIKWLLLTVYMITVWAAPDDPGPQIFYQSTPESPQNTNLGHGVVMKEVILYLTPSQIRALEATRGLNKVIPYGRSNDSNEQNSQISKEELDILEAELKSQLENQHIYLQNQKPLDLQNQPSPITEEPFTERPFLFSPQQKQRWVPIRRPQHEQKLFTPIKEEQEDSGEQYNFQSEQHNFQSDQQTERLPESYSYIKIYNNDEVHEKPKFQLFHPLPHDHSTIEEVLPKDFEIQRDPLHQKQYKLIPYEYNSEIKQYPPKLPELSKNSQWASELEHSTNYGNSADLQNQPSLQVLNDNKNLYQNENLFQKQIAELKYAPKFEDHKHAAEYQKFLFKIEKENAFAKAEAIRKSPPIIIRKEVSIKRRRPIPVVKHINVPVSTPVQFPVPKPHEVNVPRSYPVPLDIFRPIPHSIIKTEKVEVEKPSPYEVVKHVPVPITKNVLVKVDKSYLGERFVPVEIKKELPVEIPEHKPEKFTILRHVWQH